MTSAELIARLRELDPDGNMPVVEGEYGVDLQAEDVTLMSMRLFTDGHYYDWRAGERFGEEMEVIVI